MNKLALLTLPLAATLALACATTDKPKAATQKPAATAPALADASKGSVGGSVSAGPAAPAAPIYFTFDSDQLTGESQSLLKQMAGYLQANPTATLTIEGHCDETGSADYNLALGDRRARAAREYLEALGVQEVRLNSISFGEEKPAVAGTDDGAHEKNRRGQFDLKARPAAG